MFFFCKVTEKQAKYDTRLMNETRNSRLKSSFLGPGYDHGFHGQCLSSSFFNRPFLSFFSCFLVFFCVSILSPFSLIIIHTSIPIYAHTGYMFIVCVPV